MKPLLAIYVVIINIFLLSTVSYAWGPNTHMYLTKTAMDKQDTAIAQLCRNYQTELYAGLAVPDATVLEYFKNYPVGKNYRLTHNWNFAGKCFERAGDDMSLKCFCYGISTHEIQDTIAHNYFVVEKIEEFYVPNWIIHPIVEGAVEAHVITEHPELSYLTAHSMDMLFEPGNEIYLDIVQDSIGPTSVFNIRKNAYELSTMLGSFYTDAFSPKEENVFYSIWNFLAPPIAYVTNIDDAEYWLKTSSDYTENVYNNWALRLDKNVTPHGSERLAEADRFPLLLWMAIPILFIIVVYIYLLRKISVILNIETKILDIIKKR